MNLHRKKMLDWYLGGLLMAALKPWVWLIGQILKRDHTPYVRESICFIKMLGGGSLVIAYPALLALRRQYPTATFSLICAQGIRPFAQSLDVFDRIDEISDTSLPRLVSSSLRALRNNFRVDTLVDLEVYSRLTTVLSTLTCARNRVGFYLEAVFWRKLLHTHLIFFNRFSGTFLWYDAVARLLGAEPVAIEECQELSRKRFQLLQMPNPEVRRIALGHSCSDLAHERMLNEQQWLMVFREHLPANEKAVIVLLGTADEREPAARIIDVLAKEFPLLQFRNYCGELSLQDSIGRLATCQEFWGIDSALLHYARLLGLTCISFWGPTNPTTLLRPIPGLNETVRYGNVPCSPCIHVAEEPPCQGNNVCIQSLFDGDKEYDSVLWLA